MKYLGIALALSVAGLLAGCSVDASSNTSSTIFTGSVSAGAPLTNGLLRVLDSSTPPKTFEAPINTNGSYSIDTAGGVAPFLFQAQIRVDSKALNIFSASAAYSGKVNISPLTSLVVAHAAEQDCAITSCMPAIFTAARLTNAAAKVQTLMVPLLTQFGLAIADTLDAKQINQTRAKKWVFFRHIAVGGYVFSRDGPLEFIKDAATGNWRTAGNLHVKAGAKAGTGVNTYTPPAGASSFGSWIPLSTDSSAYPDGATLIAVSSFSISPPVNLVYTGEDNSAAKISGAAMVEAVAGVSFLPACPRPAGQKGSCIDVAQLGNYIYSATFSNPTAAIHGQATKDSNRNGPDVISPQVKFAVKADLD